MSCTVCCVLRAVCRALWFSFISHLLLFCVGAQVMRTCGPPWPRMHTALLSSLTSTKLARRTTSCRGTCTSKLTDPSPQQQHKRTNKQTNKTHNSATPQTNKARNNTTPTKQRDTVWLNQVQDLCEASWAAEWPVRRLCQQPVDRATHKNRCDHR